MKAIYVYSLNNSEDNELCLNSETFKLNNTVSCS